MILKSIDLMKGGEVLAEPIVSQRQDTIIPRGTVMKTEYIPLIRSMGIHHVMIENPYEDFENPHPIIETPHFDYYVTRIRKIMEGHIYHSNNSLREFEMIANEIIKEIHEIPDDIIIDVTERKVDLYEHTIMVTLLSVFIGKKLGIDRKTLYDISLGALLHDIGMRYITVTCESVDLETMDPVSIFEYKKHTILGYSALDGENWLSDISKKMILSHHETLDGLGYPMHQKNMELECRIIQVCDHFDNSISGMGCKRKNIKDALHDLAENAEIKYDKKVVELLLEMVAPYPVGTTVKTTSQEEGIVIAQTTDKNSPIIMIINGDNKEEYKQKNLLEEKNVSISQIL